MTQSEDCTYSRTDVSTLGGKATVPQFVHEPHPQFSYAERVHTASDWTIGETISRHGWNHNVERIRGIPSMRRGVGQHRDDSHHFQERAGPPMCHDERDRSRTFAALVDEMNSGGIRRVSEMMESRELLHLCFPVELVSPVIANIFEEREIEPVLPGSAGHLVWPACSPQPVPKIIHCVL